MTEHSFTLLPFPDTSIPKIMIKGRIAREQNRLTVQYSLTGEMEEILFPEPIPRPGRREELWLATCFEFFLAISGQRQYWEFNLSPSGEWNAFCMDAYRGIGFRQEQLISDIRMDIRRTLDLFHLGAAVDLSTIIDTKTDLLAGIACVIQARDGHETYWALAHPNHEADFHLRDSFILVLEGTGRL